jgi:hypothetical protein
MPNNSPEPLCPCRVHVLLRWQKWSGNVLTPSDVLVKGGRNSASMQSNDIGGGVEVHNNGLCWVGWSESPKQVLSDGHVVERCGVLDELYWFWFGAQRRSRRSTFAQAQPGPGFLKSRENNQQKPKIIPVVLCVFSPFFSSHSHLFILTAHKHLHCCVASMTTHHYIYSTWHASSVL